MKRRLFNMRDITHLYADGNDLLRRWKSTVQEGQGMTAEAKFSRRQDKLGFRDVVPSGEVVPYGHRDCWNDVIRGKTEAGRAGCRKVRHTSPDCFYFLSKLRSKVIS